MTSEIPTTAFSGGSGLSTDPWAAQSDTPQQAIRTTGRSLTEFHRRQESAEFTGGLTCDPALRGRSYGNPIGRMFRRLPWSRPDVMPTYRALPFPGYGTAPRPACPQPFPAFPLPTPTCPASQPISSCPRPAPVDPPLTLENRGQEILVTTKDGFKISTEGKDHAWTITGPDGKTTRIWGDPHVDESDGDRWDFTEQSSFIFGSNKVTVETTPLGDGTTITKAITIYHGDQRITIDGIDKNKPEITANAFDREIHDRAMADGDAYVIGKETNGDDQWFKTDANFEPAEKAARWRRFHDLHSWYRSFNRPDPFECILKLQDHLRKANR